MSHTYAHSPITAATDTLCTEGAAKQVTGVKTDFRFRHKQPVFFFVSLGILLSVLSLLYIVDTNGETGKA